MECFPQTLPKDLPDVLSKTKWTKKAAEVVCWDDWWEMHEKVVVDDILLLFKHIFLICADFEFSEEAS